MPIGHLRYLSQFLGVQVDIIYSKVLLRRIYALHNVAFSIRWIENVNRKIVGSIFIL
jgi:hypothetical protein